MRRVAARLSHVLATPLGLLALFAIGLAIRLVLARGGGHAYDIGFFRLWSERLADHGPANFYPKPGDTFFVDYPPGLLYVLWAVGKLARVFGAHTVPVFALKVPALLADLALAWIGARLAERITPAARSPVRGLAAAVVLLNPAFIFLSAVWGQADSLAAFLVVAGIFLLVSKQFVREAAGVALLAFAVGTKPQVALVLPAIAVVLLHRHLAATSERSTLAGTGRVAVLAATAVFAWLALLRPFGLGLTSGIRFYARATGTYKLTTLFAFNAWGTLGVWRPDEGAGAVRVLGVPAYYAGLLLFVIGALLVLARTWSALSDGTAEGRIVVFASAAIALIGFTFLTRIHERYLFVPVALCASLVAWKWLVRSLVVLSTLYLVNLVFPYLDHYRSLGRPFPRYGEFVYHLYGSSVGDVRQRVLSGLTAAFCVLVATMGWRWLGGAASRRPMEDVEGQHAPEIHEDA